MVVQKGEEAREPASVRSLPREHAAGLEVVKSPFDTLKCRGRDAYHSPMAGNVVDNFAT